MLGINIQIFSFSSPFRNNYQENNIFSVVLNFFGNIIKKDPNLFNCPEVEYLHCFQVFAVTNNAILNFVLYMCL